MKNIAHKSIVELILDLLTILKENGVDLNGILKNEKYDENIF